MRNLHRFYVFIFLTFFWAFGSCMLSGCAVSGCGNPVSSNSVDSNDAVDYNHNQHTVTVTQPEARVLQSPKRFKRGKIRREYSEYF